MTRGLVAIAAVSAGMLALCTLPRADAQKIDPRRAAVFVVGSPAGPSPMQRVDARRSGASKDPLPSSSLGVAWSRGLVLSIDQAPLVGADGTIAIVTARGDVVFLDGAGNEQERVSLSVGNGVSPATMTSDGTVVYTTRAGDVIGAKASLSRARFTTRVGGEFNSRAAPLALDDGGVVVATLTDLVVLDSEGGVRARVSLPESPGAALLASGAKDNNSVLVVSTSGTVFGWTPGREPVRLGSFGAPIDGGAALVDANTLLAVIEGNHLVELDLARSTRATRAIAPQGLYLGPPAIRGTSASVLALTPSRAFVVTVDAAGQETIRAPIEQRTPQPLADGGIAPLVAPPHVGPLVDPRGTLAFVGLDNRVGALSPDGVVEMLANRPCTAGQVAGIAPVGRSAVVVTCTSGQVVKVVGPDAEPSAPSRGKENGGKRREHEKPRKPPSSTAPPPRPPVPQPDLEEDDDP